MLCYIRFKLKKHTWNELRPILRVFRTMNIFEYLYKSLNENRVGDRFNDLNLISDRPIVVTTPTIPIRTATPKYTTPYYTRPSTTPYPTTTTTTTTTSTTTTTTPPPPPPPTKGQVKNTAYGNSNKATASNQAPVPHIRYCNDMRMIDGSESTVDCARYDLIQTLLHEHTRNKKILQIFAIL